MSYDDTDPFAGGVKTPSLSWKDLPVGTIFILEVAEPAKLMQSRDFDTGQPAFWDSPANTQPKMAAVVNGRVLSGPHSVGEERSIWATRPSSMFSAIAEAQKHAGSLLAVGGKLSIAFAGEKPHENKRFNAIKLYQAKYEPPTGGDVFAQAAAQRQSAPQSPPPGTQTWQQQARAQAAPVGYPSHQTTPATAPAAAPASDFKW